MSETQLTNAGAHTATRHSEGRPYPGVISPMEPALGRAVIQSTVGRTTRTEDGASMTSEYMVERMILCRKADSAAHKAKIVFHQLSAGEVKESSSFTINSPARTFTVHSANAGAVEVWDVESDEE